jgi:hypothetical protein
MVSPQNNATERPAMWHARRIVCLGDLRSEATCLGRHGGPENGRKCTLGRRRLLLGSDLLRFRAGMDRVRRDRFRARDTRN